MACSSCQKISGMAKRKKSYRRRRVSGVGKGLFSTKSLIPAAAVVGVSYLAGDKLPIVNTKTGAKIEAAAGAFMVVTSFLGRSPMLKGIGLGLLVDGGKKVFTGSDWKGNALAEGGIAGLRPLYLDKPSANGAARRLAV